MKPVCCYPVPFHFFKKVLFLTTLISYQVNMIAMKKTKVFMESTSLTLIEENVQSLSSNSCMDPVNNMDLLQNSNKSEG